MSEKLIVRGAREHNLKNVSIELPRDQLIVFTGLSGSGKSSLAFDTIYAEGQRRYVESLSSYARQFLGQMDKPDVDFIEGLSPAISIDQKSASRNPRSTVGTITEIYDYLRLLYARIGVPHCPKCGRQITRQTPQQIVDRVLELPEGTRFQVLAPVVRGRKGEYESLLADLGRQGYTRARVDGEVIELTGTEAARPRLARYEQHTIEVVVDRLVRRPGIERRLTDSLETALRLAEGVAEVEIVAAKEGEGSRSETLTFSQHLACAHCGLSFDELAPRNFSFNSPYGACERCDGLGTRFEVDPELVVGDDELSIDGGAIAPWAGFRGEYFGRVLQAVAKRQRLRHRHAVEEARRRPTARSSSTGRAASRCSSSTATATAGPAPTPPATRGSSPGWSGATPRRRATGPGSRSRATCGRCPARSAAAPGSGRPPWRCKVGGKNIHEVTSLPIRDSARFFAELELSERDRIIAERVLKEVNERLTLPARRRARLPVAGPVGGHAGRRGGAAHPARLPDRQRPRRRALRPRRAVDRPPPAGQPAPHRHHDPPPQLGQHRDRGGARRGDHPGRRPHRRHRARRRDPRRRDRGRRHARGPHGRAPLDHRRLPLRPAADPRAGDAARPRATTGSWCGAPGSTTSRASTWSSPSAASWPSPA